MPVTRCVCFDVELDRIRAIVRDEGQTFAKAHERTGFGARCGLCVPYAIRAVQANIPVVPVMWCEDFRRCGIPPGAIEKLEIRIPEPDRERESASPQSGSGSESEPAV